MVTVLQVFFFLAAPGAVLWACSRSKVLNALSAAALCYGVGIAFGNVAGLDHMSAEVAALSDGPGALSPAEKLTSLIAGLGVILALGMLLVSTDFKKWLRLAPVTLLGAFLAMFSAVVVAGSTALIFRGMHPELWKVSGMLVGVYTGGTVNLAAIAQALEVDAVTVGIVNAADMLICGLWLFVLLAAGPWFFGLFLKPFAGAALEGDDPAEAHRAVGALDVLKSLGVALLAAGPPLLMSQVVGPSLEDTIAILGVTTVAIGLSFVPFLRRVHGLFETGEYLLLVFCVAIGSLATWGRLAEADPALFGFTAIVVFGAVALHAALCWLFGVDRDTTVITSVAALFGPPFVPPVAAALKNREIVVSGVTSGLVGLAAGNFLGLAVAYGVRSLGG